MGNFRLMFFICIPVVMLCLFGFCRKEGIWGTLIKAFCLFFATMFAMNYFEPLANLMDRMVVSWAYYNDMWAFLIIFVSVLAIELFLTNRLSRVNVAFSVRANKIGAYLLLTLIFLGFYGVVAQSFYYLLPEAPSQTTIPENVNNPIQFRLLEIFSSGSLAPMTSPPAKFSYNDFFINEELKRKAAVYSKVGGPNSGSDKGDWRFKGTSSPNIKPAQ